jgi:hypothetical protein
MDIQDLFPVAITFVALGVLLAFGLSVQTDVRDDFTALSYEYNASNNAVVANANLSSKLPILGTIVIAAIVVGVLIKAFVFR